MKKFEVIYPKWDDPRWKLLAIQLSFIVYTVLSPGFTRTWTQFAATLAGTLLTEIAFLLYKKLPIVPVSGILPAAAIMILVDSETNWIYFVVGVISLASKHLIRNRQRHIFVPNNFGIVFGILFLQSYMTTTVGRWGGDWAPLVVITMLGLYMSHQAGRLALSLAYIATFLAALPVRHALNHVPLLTLFAPFTGAAFQQFTFFVMTDPIVTPRPVRWQVLFGIAVGVVDAFIRHNQIKYAPFFALMVVCAVYSFLEDIFGWEWTRPWSLGKAVVTQESLPAPVRALIPAGSE